MREAPEDDKAVAAGQLKILSYRAGLLRRAILFAGALLSLIIALLSFLQGLNQALIIFHQDIGE